MRLWILAVLCALAVQQQTEGLLLRLLSKSKFTRRLISTTALLSSRGDEGEGEGSNTSKTPSSSKMPLGPPVGFWEDFAREDIVPPPPKQAPTSLLEKRKPEAPPKREIVINPTGWIEDPNRPTGYGRPDLNDNEEEMRQKMLDDNWTPAVLDESPLQRWFRETYIGTPYDSRKKQQARYVIKNITAICFSIGFIFTAVWFAFPGKFISVRGDKDFSQRYQQSFVEPEGLLSEDWQRSQAPSTEAFYDDAKGLPDKGIADQRIPLEQGKTFRLAPPPSLDL